jgi:two-component system, OmpR family, sensor histidine kinase VicK
LKSNPKIMKKKINILIVLSTLVLLSLCFIQLYLVKTTYRYKVAQFRMEVKDRLSKITNDYTTIDSTIFHQKDFLYQQLAKKYIINQSNGKNIKEELLQNQFRDQLTIRLQQEFDKEFPDHSVEFAIILKKFILYHNSKKADTLMAEKSEISNKMCGDLASLEDAFLVRNYVGTTSTSSENSNYKLLTEDALYVSVANFEWIVLKRMSLLLTFAFVSILVLVTIFVITIKSLIQQKKISDIKTDFINNITHELKTPLTTLSVSTKILARKEIKENEQAYQHLLQTINRQNERLQQLIDQVLHNSLGHQEIELRKEKIEAESFLQSITNDFQTAHPLVTIQTQFSAEKTTLVLDTFHLTTALLNVLENAVKYGCSTIFISATRTHNLFTISVKDNGIGIDKSQHHLLFDKFYRVEKGNIHNSKGLGLGLYYVDQIIKAHKGRVDVISDLGKGTQLNLILPFSV